jgi:hypothetical protein
MTEIDAYRTALRVLVASIRSIPEDSDLESLRCYHETRASSNLESRDGIVWTLGLSDPRLEVVMQFWLTDTYVVYELIHRHEGSVGLEFFDTTTEEITPEQMMDIETREQARACVVGRTLEYHPKSPSVRWSS